MQNIWKLSKQCVWTSFIEMFCIFTFVSFLSKDNNHVSCIQQLLDRPSLFVFEHGTIILKIKENVLMLYVKCVTKVSAGPSLKY